MSGNTSPSLPPRVKNLVGQTFGRLKVTDFSHRNERSDQFWLCHCSCGKDKAINGSSLTSNRVLSCGCLRSENMVNRNVPTHGMSHSMEYKSWRSMLDRCLNPNDKSWSDYGGRGITVCDEWKESFESFFADMGLKPGPKHSIERCDNSKGYSKGNCRWATSKEQNRNRRSNTFVEMDGKRLTIVEWCEIYGIHPNTVHSRIGQRRWSVERAIKTPVP